MRGIVEFCGQGCKDTLQVRKHVIVPEAHHAKIVLSEPAVTFNVSRRPGMLAAVHFNNQPRFKAKEVRYIRPNWNLAPKLE